MEEKDKKLGIYFDGSGATIIIEVDLEGTTLALIPE